MKLKSVKIVDSVSNYPEIRVIAVNNNDEMASFTMMGLSGDMARNVLHNLEGYCNRDPSIRWEPSNNARTDEVNHLTSNMTDREFIEAAREATPIARSNSATGAWLEVALVRLASAVQNNTHHGGYHA